MVRGLPNTSKILLPTIRESVGRYRLTGSAFAAVCEFTQAQRIADGLRVRALHRKLEAFVRCYCPAIADLGVTCHLSIDPAEYSTDAKSPLLGVQFYHRDPDVGYRRTSQNV
jgi:hypothetical protein